MAEVKDQAALSLAFVRRVARIFRLLLGTRLGILVFYAGIGQHGWEVDGCRCETCLHKGR